MLIGNRPFEIPLVKKKKKKKLYDTLLCLFVCTIQMNRLQMEVAQEFLNKTGRKLADTREHIMAALVLLMHIL